MVPVARLGIDRILENPTSFPRAFDAGASIGFVTSDGAPPGRGRAGAGPVRDRTSRGALLETGSPLSLLFTPEHGLSATAPDGADVEDEQDPVTGLPVTSLYGPRLVPRIRDLKELDLVLFDLQDVGARFYTFLWTLSHVMEACAEAGTPLWVLDRPNPLGGLPQWVEGPVPDSDAPPDFLGRWSIPVRHSLTLGELANLLEAEMGLDLDLEVVAMEGWGRGHLWPDSGLAWYPPSPGMPAFHSALLYPGLALLEATNVLEGRGTDLAFQWFGAPWMDPSLGAEEINRTGFPGVLAHPHDLFQGGASCPGVHLEITDASVLRPVYLGLRLLALLRTLWPGEFAWTPYPTTANPGGDDHLFRLLASRALVSFLEEGSGGFEEPRLAEWTQTDGWWERAEPHLLYS